MENIRAFFNMVEEYLTHYKEIIEYKSDFYKYPTFGNLDYYDTCDITYKIASKLFSMNKDDRSIYAKLIIELLETECSVIGLDGYEKTFQTVYIRECGPERIKCNVGCIDSDIDFFIQTVFSLFLDFGIDIPSIINSICDESSILKDICNDAIKYGKRSSIEINKIRKQRNPITANQQYDTIKALLNAAGWEGADNTKIAEFVAWLVNGSPTYIRQYILSGESRDKDKKNADSKLIEEKFKLIGMSYNDGEIKK